MPSLGEQLSFSTAAGSLARIHFQLELQAACSPRAAAPINSEGVPEPSLAEAGVLALVPVNPWS